MGKDCRMNMDLSLREFHCEEGGRIRFSNENSPCLVVSSNLYA